MNCVYPGLVATEMGLQLASDMATLGLFPSAEHAVGAVVELTPAGLFGEVPDMADAVVFLASDGARFITGAGLPVTAAWACDRVLLTSSERHSYEHGQAGRRLRCLRVHRPADLRVPAGVQHPLRGRRTRQGPHLRGPGPGTRHRHGAARGDRGRAPGRAADRAADRGEGRAQHGRAVREARRRGGRGVPGGGLPLPRHHRRAGLADHLRRDLRRADGRARAAARAGRGADVHHRGDRGQHLPRAARPGHARHRGVLEGAAHDRLDPHDPGQRGPGQGLLPRAERVRGMARRRRAVHRRGARPARDRPRAALGRHLAPGLVPPRPAVANVKVLSGTSTAR